MKHSVSLFLLIIFPVLSYSQKNEITMKFINNAWTTDEEKLKNANPDYPTEFKAEGCEFDSTKMKIVYLNGNPEDLAKDSNTNTFKLSSITKAELEKKPQITISCNESSNTFDIFQNNPDDSADKKSAEGFFEENDKTKNIYSRNIRYAGNKAYIFLDENGKYLGKLPVNLDEDDIIYLYMAVKKSEKNDYQIEITEGEYSPVDLQILPGQDIKTQSSLPREEWDLITVIDGPFTSDYFAFSVKKKKGENLVTISSYKIKINNLYHLQIGASFVATYLRKPVYKISPLTDTTNTIIDVSNNSRTLITVNVIWYLKPILKYFFGGSKLMRGRDVLKEPTFIQRINPTFGVSLSENIAENFFFGLTLEFARGGSIIGGGHYGKTLQLADEKFELGKTQFNGQQDKIITKDKYEWKWFFGVTLDSRVFNKLFVGGGS